ncbi:MAG TPA: SGNH/GDSL hydrolase family protein [Lacipirellulaceae bacterium]|nr:SGNH/GDSL hydrolase family protein [Lacipirellulaceae bacterium]
MSDKQRFELPTASRRRFFQASAGLGAAGLAAFAGVGHVLGDEREPVAKRGESLIEAGDTILFQGDSITDMHRKRDVTRANSEAALGTGYAWLAAAELLIDMPKAGLKIFNRGVSGDKVYQLADRWQADCLDLRPDVLSILVGVNDFWHTLNGTYKGTVEKYETDYRALIRRTKKALPKVKLIICEPFTLRTGHVNDKWFPTFEQYRAVAKKVADEAGAVFIPFQTMFDRATKIAPPHRWAADGVHPTSDGAAIMAHWWLRTVGE